MSKTDPKILEKNRLWREANREKVLELGRRYYQEHKEARQASSKQRYIDNKEAINKEAAIRGTARRRKLRLDILATLGNKCIQCGFSDVRALCIDHVNGGGEAERKSKAVEAYYNHIKREIKAGSLEYQLLCANCHQIRHYEDFLPHRKHCE